MVRALGPARSPPRPRQSRNRPGARKPRSRRRRKTRSASRRRCFGTCASRRRSSSRAPGERARRYWASCTSNEDRYAEVSSAIAAQAVRLVAAPGDRVAAGQSLLELASLDVGKARGEYPRGGGAARSGRAGAGPQARPGRRADSSPARGPGSGGRRAGRGGGLRRGRRDPGEPGRRKRRDEGAGSRCGRRSPAWCWSAASCWARSWSRDECSSGSPTEDALARRTRLGARCGARAGGLAGPVALPALPGRDVHGPGGARGEAGGRRLQDDPRPAEVRNEDGVLRPGMSATVWLPVGEEGRSCGARGRRAAPSRELVRIRSAEAKGLRGPCGRPRPRSRRRSRGPVRVSPGETVVVEGAFLLKAEGEKAEGEGGHHDH